MENLNIIFECKFGSHLYGTDTPSSDLDIKGIYIPTAREIALGKIQRSIVRQTKPSGQLKNTQDDIDIEYFSLDRYVNLLADGQMVAIDMLFAPTNMHLKPASVIFTNLFCNRHKILNRGIASYVGYCRQQANKYGIKGSRMGIAKSAEELFKDLLDSNTSMTKLSEVWPAIEAWVAKHNDHAAIVEMESQGAIQTFVEVCNKKMSKTITIKMAYSIINKLYREYGERSRQAEVNQGIDWKALSHAVRAGTQAIELLDTGLINFPLHNAKHLLDVKLGKVPYAEVASEIEWLLDEMHRKMETSVLPEKSDTEWIETFIYSTYAMQFKY